MTVAQWRRHAVARLLADAGRSAVAAQGEVDRLLAVWAGVTVTERLRCPDLKLAVVSQLDAGLDQLCRGVPLGYVLGVAAFRYHEFQVGPGVLIPRADSEVVVDLALEVLGGGASEPVLLDLGAGSGCLGLSFVRECPGARVVSVDLYEAPLACCRDNVARLQLQSRAQVVRGDMTDLGRLAVRLGMGFDGVISNPPYVGEHERPLVAPSVSEFEPEEAVFAPGAGLHFYRHFATAGAQLLRPGGCWVVEIGYSQQEAVRELFERAGWSVVAQRRDLHGHVRGLAMRPAEGR